ncbi:MAG: hypothetical protein M3071_05930, partial [Actinomycetota bacterium]|nr:hypothetical protein [Actinomycetota bacterium]
RPRAQPLVSVDEHVVRGRPVGDTRRRDQPVDVGPDRDRQRRTHYTVGVFEVEYIGALHTYTWRYVAGQPSTGA